MPLVMGELVDSGYYRAALFRQEMKPGHANRPAQTHGGKAVVTRNKKEFEVVDMPRSIPHNYVLWVEFDGSDVWVGTSKGVGRAIGHGYYSGVTDRPVNRAGKAAENAMGGQGH